MMSTGGFALQCLHREHMYLLKNHGIFNFVPIKVIFVYALHTQKNNYKLCGGPINKGICK